MNALGQLPTMHTAHLRLGSHSRVALLRPLGGPFGRSIV